MNIDELLLNINDVSMESRVWQTEIQTAEDKAKYQKKGYTVELTESEFREKYNGIDPACVCYTPSISCNALYFNENTLAVCYLPFIGLLSDGKIGSPEWMQRAVDSCEKEAAEKDFLRSVMCMPDGMKFSYLEMLVEKYGTDIPDFYDIFFSVYKSTDYGFGSVSPKVIEAAVAAKSKKDAEKLRDKMKELPDVVTVYRGGNTASTKPEEAYSWTTDINVANFFAARRGTGDGYIVTAEVNKRDIIEYFPESEKEIVVSPEKVRIQERMGIYGKDFLSTVGSGVFVKYEAYKKKLEKLGFAQDSEAHGRLHELRVLLLALMIADNIGVSDADMDVLATAAIYHDTMRVNDFNDEVHGRDGRTYYQNTVKKPSLLTSIICEYHCLPDEEGYACIRATFKNKEKQKRYMLLYDIFKDADALDRVRFGLMDLDINQLRNPISKQLSCVARMIFQSLREK